jgi:hypothetical protein
MTIDTDIVCKRSNGLRAALYMQDAMNSKGRPIFMRFAGRCSA